MKTRFNCPELSVKESAYIMKINIPFLFIKIPDPIREKKYLKKKTWSSQPLVESIRRQLASTDPLLACANPLTCRFVIESADGGSRDYDRPLLLPTCLRKWACCRISRKV